MNYPYISIFPSGIDRRIYFSDINIDGVPIMDTYNQLISERKYTEANNFISQQNVVHHYSADLFNYIEAIIESTQEYISNLEKYNPFHTSDAEPSIEVNEFWI